MTEGTGKVRCPKCGGSIFFDKDCYGWYEKCLCCGWTRDLPDIVLSGGDKQRRGGAVTPDKTTGKLLGHGTGKK